jgi:hypothetical protein
MPRPGTLEICRKYLYENIDQIPEAYRDRVKRVRVGFSHWYEFPSTSRSRIRDLIVHEFGVTGKTAYEDIQVIEILLGNIKNPEKAWIRYRVNTFLEEAYRLAKLQKDPKAMAIAADKMGKYNMLDKPDADPLPFDEIVPQTFEPTDDPSSLGLKKDPDIREKKKRMIEKYIADIEITDVPYEELKPEDDKEQEEDLL